MAWWLERLKRPWKRLLKETSGNLYLELCPDNRIKSFMVVRHRPKGTDPFMEFIGHTADKAIREGNGQVPDNLLLALEGSTGKNASDKGGAPGGTPRKHMEAHLRIWRNNRRKTGPAQTGRLPEGARKGDRPYCTRRDGAFTRLPELRGL